MRLAWQMTDPFAARADGLLPFFIDWGASPHPAAAAIKGCALLDLQAEHPEAQRIQTILNKLELNFSVTVGKEPCLVATLATPRGEVELR